MPPDASKRRPSQSARPFTHKNNHSSLYLLLQNYTSLSVKWLFLTFRLQEQVVTLKHPEVEGRAL